MKLRVVAIQEDGRKVMAKDGCRKCYGRGYVGNLIAEGSRLGSGMLLCDCLILGSAPAASTKIIKSGLWDRIKRWISKIIGAGEARKRAVVV